MGLVKAKDAAAAKYMQVIGNGSDAQFVACIVDAMKAAKVSSRAMAAVTSTKCDKLDALEECMLSMAPSMASGDDLPEIAGHRRLLQA
jgi:hypothetical protein